MNKESLSVLFVGETNIVHMIEHKGLDALELTRYTEFATPVRNLFEAQGHRFTHVACHIVHEQFPSTIEGIRRYDVVILSDIGSNTMLLHQDYLNRTVNSLKLIEQYVATGGGFIMIGGYFSFTGFQAKARYKDTPIEELLPVTMQPYDDRVEIPEGVNLTLDPALRHPIVDGLPREWPHVFGYNRLTAKAGATVLVKSERGDPIIAVGSYGDGRAVAYATDCAQDWASPQLLGWEHYGKLWNGLLRWTAGGS
ncbi:glutamine amidotransferase [Mesorhizobium sp. NPDC059054]|uniref:glutamine amidotransferase n=1 Tax=Mesorhizobium sp. NPDC059054 TaxID=3346711 RepID=UPI0036CB005A